MKKLVKLYGGAPYVESRNTRRITYAASIGVEECRCLLMSISILFMVSVFTILIGMFVSRLFICEGIVILNATVFGRRGYWVISHCTGASPKEPWSVIFHGSTMVYEAQAVSGERCNSGLSGVNGLLVKGWSASVAQLHVAKNDVLDSQNQWAFHLQDPDLIICI